jgi:nitronate monooxygenase
VHDEIKQALVRASERDTNLIFRSLRNTARVLKNAVSDEVVAIERRGGATFEDIRPLVLGTRGRAALQSGEVHNGIVSAGMVVGLIDDVPSCAELIERIVRECRESLRVANERVS